MIDEAPEDVISKIKVGMVIKHKAFGEGVVNDISNGLIEVKFGKKLRKFQFPGAFLQGFLSK